MDIAPYIAFGDRHLRNQYYFVVSPLQATLLAAGLLLPPWIGAWYGGKAGFWWAVLLQLLLIAGLNGHTLISYFLRIGQDESSYDVFWLMLNFTLLQVMAAAVSAIGAWLWTSRRGKAQGITRNDTT